MLLKDYIPLIHVWRVKLVIGKRISVSFTDILESGQRNRLSFTDFLESGQRIDVSFTSKH